MQDKRLKIDGMAAIVGGLILFPFFIIAIIYSHPLTFTDYLMFVIGIAFFAGIILLLITSGIQQVRRSKNIKK